MNGRCYDPILGRFLSPDNYVQSPGYAQNYNRYSYCLNNPTKYTDPSGEVFGIDDAIIIGCIIAGAYLGGVATNQGELNPAQWQWTGQGAWKTYTGIGIGALVGYVGGWYAVNPASLTWQIGVAGGGGSAYLVGSGSDWSFQWSDSAGGGGRIPLSGNNQTSTEAMVSEQIAKGIAIVDRSLAAYNAEFRTPKITVDPLIYNGWEWPYNPFFFLTATNKYQGSIEKFGSGIIGTTFHGELKVYYGIGAKIGGELMGEKTFGGAHIFTTERVLSSKFPYETKLHYSGIEGGWGPFSFNYKYIWNSNSGGWDYGLGPLKINRGQSTGTIISGDLYLLGGFGGSFNVNPSHLIKAQSQYDRAIREIYGNRYNSALYKKW